MTAIDGNRTVTGVSLAFGAAAVALLAVGIADVWPWISDDAFISLRYAERCWQGQGLTWNDGERVEGYSNLLWVLLTCALRPLIADPVAIVRGLGIAATVATLIAVARTCWLGRGVAATAAIVLAALQPTALWAIGGLETPLALLLTTAGLIDTGRLLHERDERVGAGVALRAGIWFALSTLTRPDGPLAAVLAAVAIALFARRGPAGAERVLLRRLLGVAAPVAIAMLLQLAFRLAYYGDWVPNTAHAKVGVSANGLRLGLAYVASATVILRALLLPAAIGAVLGVLDRRLRPMTLLCAAFTLAFAAYTVSVGGDLFPLCRILLPTLGALALLAGIGLQRLARTRTGAIAAVALALAAAVTARLDARPDDGDPWQRLSDWEWEGEAVGGWLRDAFATTSPPPLLALDAAGGVPFFSGLPCLDMLGLNDRHIATAPLPAPEHVLPGHSRGDGAYVLDRAPDLVLFASPTGDREPRWPGSWQMEADPRFLRDYRCVVARTGEVEVEGQGRRDLKLALWVRQDGRVGVRPPGADGSWLVPGLLLAGHRQEMPIQRNVPDARRLPADPQRLAQTYLAKEAWWQEEAVVAVRMPAPDGGLAGEFRRQVAATVSGLALLPGDWLATPIPADAAVDCRLEPDGDGLRLVVAPRPDAVLPLRVQAIRITPR